MTALIAAVALYRTEVISYALWILLLYASLFCIDALIRQRKHRVALVHQLHSEHTGKGAIEVADAELPAESSLHAAARWNYCVALMFAAVALFLLASWQFPEGAPFQMAGMQWLFRFADMWFLLRTLSFIWEYGSGRTELEFLPFLTWMVLPCTVYGPLLRFGDFHEQFWAFTRNPVVRIPAGWWRLLVLAVLQIASATFLRGLDENIWFHGSYVNSRVWKGIITFGTGPWEFYLRAAGTFHIMECFGWFWGLKLPPSFQCPLGQPNIAEFWKRWNMSATSFFRDHLFYNRWGLDRPNLYLNSVILFTMMGLWHAINWHWFIYGLLHGLAFCTFLWWRAHRNHPLMRKITLPPIAADIMSRIVTYLFIGGATVAPSKFLQFVSSRRS
jgi:D-alanyl-lipoteichoic acid acyltransferase DltB (MBOAT superfamily)